MSMTLKLGKKAATYDPRDFLFARYRTAVPLPLAPRSFGHEKIIGSDWGMMGNDVAGDCVFAGACHETMIWLHEGGRGLASFTDRTALADYSAVTGFDPNDPSTDQGTNVRDALKYRRSVGIVDELGKRHKIAAFMSLEPGNIDHLVQATYLFGAVGIGINFPNSAMDQFNRGRIWSVVPGTRVEGGHYVPLVARRTTLECVTWGKIQHMTLAFIKKYCDEAWCILSEEMLDGKGLSPEHLDLAMLRADLNAL